MMRYLAITCALIASTALGDFITIGSEGINSKVTGLDGSEIQIGMAESGRSGKANYDALGFSASNTIPEGVYFQNAGGMAGVNAFVSEHATWVAGVIIGKGQPNPDYEGVAPNAQLHSIAVEDLEDDSKGALALNRLALLNDGAIKAINLSYIRELQPFVENTNGKSHLAQFIDWSARRHDVLYVVLWGNEDQPMLRTPTDNYNGITVAASTFGDDGNYSKLWFGNHPDGDAQGIRTSIDLLAPGEVVNVLGPNNQGSLVSGTSFAAPHVTGATALLQQYAKPLVDAGTDPRWGENSQRHEVMKAVLMNSVDKLDGVHGSTRTVVDAVGQDWTQFPAYNSVFTPLDEKMGAGHLNVRRSVQQFSSGEFDPGIVPMIGWAYDTIGPNDRDEYILEQPVAADEYISVTLAWDRIVNHSGGNTYSAGDQFLSYNDENDILNNLDVYLMLEDDTELLLAAWTSKSSHQNVEHIFFQFHDVPLGEYKIVVHHNGGLDTNQAYALAWWFGNPAIPGDYDGNGSVGTEDYDLWKADFGSMTELAADGNGNGIVDAADYTVWRDNLGAGSGSVAATVPEPAGTILLLIGSAAALMERIQVRIGSIQESSHFAGILRPPSSRTTSPLSIAFSKT